MPDDVPGYRVMDQVGQGGFSVVYRAHQVRLDRVVALKVLNVGAVDDAAMRRFARECRITGRLTGHPHIVTVLDTGMTASGAPFIAMEYFEHGSLADRVEREGPLPVPDVLRVGVKIASALAAVHEAGVLHRDVKPQNILISRYGEPALADFGVALLTEAPAASQTAAFTPQHTAPEVLNGATPRPASDVYALGSTLYHLLAGRPAFPADPEAGPASLIQRVVNEAPPRIERADLRDEVLDAVWQAMAKDPDDRFPTAISLATHLRRLQLQLGFPVTELPLAGAGAAASATRGRFGGTRTGGAAADVPGKAAAGGGASGKAAAGPVPGERAPAGSEKPVSPRDRLLGEAPPVAGPDPVPADRTGRPGAVTAAFGRGQGGTRDQAQGAEPGVEQAQGHAQGPEPGVRPEQEPRGVFEPVIASTYDTGAFGDHPPSADGPGAFGPAPGPGENGVGPVNAGPGPMGNGAGPGTGGRQTLAGLVSAGHPGRVPGTEDPGGRDGATVAFGSGGHSGPGAPGGYGGPGGLGGYGGPPGPGWTAAETDDPGRTGSKGVLITAGVVVFAVIVVIGIAALVMSQGNDHPAAASPPPAPVRKTSAAPASPRPTAKHSAPAVSPARIKMARPRDVRAKAVKNGHAVVLRWKLTRIARTLPLYVRRTPGAAHAVRLRKGAHGTTISHLKPKIRYCFEVFTLVRKGDPPTLAKAHPVCTRTARAR